MINQLKTIGLSEKEAKTYMAMLELGPSAVLEIAVKAGINRPTAYVQIESLKKQGLVSMQMRGKRQLYIAEDPEQLEVLLHKEKKELEHREEELKVILPELKNYFRKTDSKPVVRFFEGKEGLVRMQKALLHSGAKEVKAISSADDIYRIFPQHGASYTPERVKKGIHSKLIYTSSDGPLYKEKDTNMLREALYIPKEAFDFHADIDIYGDFVSISALAGTISGIIIEHRDLANSFRMLFDFLWEIYKKEKRALRARKALNKPT